MKKLLDFAPLALVCALGASFALHANSVRAADATPVTVAVAPTPDMALMIIAVKQGFLARQGLAPQLQMFDASPAAIQGLVAGRADITENTEPPQLAARARGGKVVQVMTAYLSARGNGSVVNSSVIKSPQDFIGKTIGVQRGSGANFHLSWFLSQNHIKPDQVTVRYLDAPDQLPALARGDIQALFSWEPFLAKAQATVPNAKIFHRSGEDGVVFSGNVLMREALAKDHPDTAVKIVEGLVAAADWMTAHPADAAKVANEVLNAPDVNNVQQQIALMQWPAEFRKSMAEQETRIAQWGIGMGLFPARDGKQLVNDLVYPAIIKQAEPSRTDF